MAHREPAPQMTPQEYLAFERACIDAKHEYVNGEVRAMSGASLEHVTIVGNTFLSLANQLRGRSCRVLMNDMRVRVFRGYDYTYVYPDLAVVCGTPELEDSHFDTLLNPLLVVEVLSESTSDYDRGEKWAKYRQIPTLQDYLVIAQDRPHVERYVRQSEPFWLFSETDEIADTIYLASLDCSLALRDIYDQVFDGPQQT